ncbi:hypothetical protein [Legionella longbeachae]|uniref:hypothetical protein n=1 Tax=Legionella longbeachae TaxID=450 RepID=UPI001246757F|nr:hypothetical protein [Legionella longbeachae]QEY52354.1 hypothetical protein FQU71_14605 [Legionella longbeachae]
MKEKKPSEKLNNVSNPAKDFLAGMLSPEVRAKEFLYVIEKSENYNNELEVLTENKKFPTRKNNQNKHMSQTLQDNLLPEEMSVSELKKIIPKVLEEYQIVKEELLELGKRQKELSGCLRRVEELEKKYKSSNLDEKESKEYESIIQKYDELKINYEKDQIEKKLFEANRKFNNLQSNLNGINHCMEAIYTHLMFSKRDQFFDILTTYYNSMEGKQEPHKRLIYSMLYAVQVSEYLHKDKFGIGYPGAVRLNQLFFEYAQTRKEYEEKIGFPKQGSTNKLILILNSFMDNYMKSGATASELREKLKPVEQYYDIQITSEGLTIKLKEGNNLLSTNPVDVLNALFKKFYDETTVFSRSMNALKSALDEHGVTYETPNDWYSYMNWSVPLITDKNSVIINYDDQAYVEYQKQQGEREDAFFNNVINELEGAQNIIKICTDPKEINRKKEMQIIVTQLLDDLNEVYHGKKVLCFETKIKNDLVRKVLELSIESLKDLNNKFPQIDAQEILDVLGNLKKGLNLAEEKLAPIKIGDDKQIVNKIIDNVYKNLEKKIHVNRLGCIGFKPNLKIKEAIESYGTSTNSTEKLSENVIRLEEPKINTVEERWNNCKGKINLNLISQIMNNFVEEYAKYKGWIKGGASLEEIQKKLGHLDQYFEIREVEGKFPEVVCKPELNTVDPKILFNDMFKKFYNESGYMGSRSTESLKNALTNKGITFNVSSQWPYRGIPEVTDEKNRFKSVESPQIVNEIQVPVHSNLGNPKN